MATLFERLIGLGDESLEKISIHSFRAVMYEFNRGQATVAQAVNAFNLTPAQITDAQRLIQAVNEANNKERFVIKLFDLLALGESGIIPEQYQSEAYFWLRIGS